MANPAQPAGERPIEQAPEWVRARMTPTEQLVEAHEEAQRFLAGEPTARVAPVGDIDELFDSDRGAA